MIIENDAEHEAMLEVLDDLMKNTPGSIAIGVIGKLIEEYELVHFPLPEPTAEEAAAFRAEQERPRCLAHLPSDDGWNDATRANYERLYGEAPPCTCEGKP